MYIHKYTHDYLKKIYIYISHTQINTRLPQENFNLNKHDD